MPNNANVQEVQPGGKRPSVLKSLSQKQIFWPLVMFLAMLLFNGIVSGGEFFNISIVEGHLYGKVIDIFRNGSKLMILATGMTMVLATGGTDISVGSVMAISGAIACSIIEGNILPGAGGNFVIAIIVALLAGLVCGLWNGFLVSKIKLQPIVATMILMVAGRGIAQLITNGKIITLSTTSDANAYYFLNGGYIFGIPFTLFIVVFVVLIIMLFNKGTAFNLYLQSTGINSKSSSFSGVKVDRIKWFVYAFCGVTAALAGLLESAGIKGADCNNSGLYIEMDAILAVALGGTSLDGGRFSIPASLFGALIIQSINATIYNLGLSPEFIRLVKATVVIVVCIVQSPKFKEIMSNLIKKAFSKGKAVPQQ